MRTTELLSNHLKSDIILITVALIWGSAFVAQRLGMAHVGPFTFTGTRFLLGCLFLFPFIIRQKRDPSYPPLTLKSIGIISFTAGSCIFAGASIQQIGLIHTTAGNAGFITGLYVVLVPLLGIFFRQKTSRYTVLGALFATIGLYLLSVTEGYTISKGDFIVMIGTLFWASHVLVVGWLTRRYAALHIAIVQFATCAVFSLMVAAGIENIELSGLKGALFPILYGGVVSVGIGYTLQVVAQKTAHPAHTAIILSLESVVAAIAGYLFLNELLTPRQLAGCGVMLFSMLISQWGTIYKKQ